jgi:Rieske Fe-S protein
MSTNEDKYPVESDRRRFVKGVVGAAAVAGIGSTGAAAINTATPPAGSGGGITQFMGIERTGGPAPRGMPQIPIEIGDDGTISGYWPEVREEEIDGQTITLAEEEIAGITYTADWFQYCGIQTSPAILPAADHNNDFLSSETTQYEWQNEELEAGEPLTLEHFDDYEEWGNEIGSDGIGKPAAATWRSDELDSGDQLNVLVIRSPQIEELAEEDEWLAETTDQGVFAILNVCTHFCCIPGYKVSETAERIGAGDGIFCQCHQSIYDPFEIFQQQFVALPRPDDLEAEADGGGGDDDDDDDGGDENGEEEMDEEGGDDDETEEEGDENETEEANETEEGEENETEEANETEEGEENETEEDA